MQSPEKPQAEFDLYAVQYNELLADPLRDRFSSSEYFHRRKIDVLLDWLRAAGKTPDKLRWLDVGCGTGELLRMGKAHFDHACGCDLSAESLRFCEGLDVRRQSRPDEIPFEPASFDVVTAACVFHHVEPAERLGLVRAVRGALAPGGLFAMFEHNPRNPVTRTIVRRCPVDVNAILLYPREPVTLFEKVGLEGISVRHYLFAPEFLGRWVRGLERGLGRLPYGGQYAAFGTRPRG